MQDVIFEEEEPIVRQIKHKSKKDSVLSRLVVATHLAKNHEEAQLVLLVVAVAAFILALVLVIFVINPPRKTISPAEQQASMQRETGQ